MWIIIMAISFLYTVISANEVCNNTKCGTSLIKTCEPLQWSDFENCENVNLNNNSIENIKPTSTYTILKKLDLSHNKLSHLPENFLSNAFAVQEINLGNNHLEQLPINFLSNSSKLQVLQLEGNLLTKIPSSVFHHSLLNLRVDCSCDVASNIIEHLSNNLTDHSKLSVTCATSSSESSFEKVDYFFARNCGLPYLLALYIALPIVAVGLIACGVALYLCKKNSSANFGSKTATETSPSHVQPRYTTRNMDMIGSTSNQGPRQEYENVFVGNFQTNKTNPHEYSEEQNRPGAPSKQTVEEGIYLESDVHEGDQPIYCNTQGVYYNYCDHGPISTNKEEDDVYILPDH